ncbi:hypothetical protein PHYSODRAFT_523033 [Phytophthora sojae]|uniref:Kazal-like domain-containing protein n=1 Tax=Phytophthora sojae (strain P6497) TaxID=1094619 RepID=G5A329_PHYSP|nr:hypothetical protein PHYSODRAFT_523033 [Phytophthora sojae]EGZ10069.1 hypothetical protein PHYSODRAFT_523033 [Phytophthora sojae]|eukprot:XP_009534930.1 hypothetical protein PHYSODRAFT_523033 [Phytophthora sojae]
MKFAVVAALASQLIVGISAQEGSNGCAHFDCPLPPSFPLICASNGVTNRNNCEFEFENCEVDCGQLRPGLGRD